MKKACFPFFLKDYHGMIGTKENGYFRETPSGRIIIAKYDQHKAEMRQPTDNQLLMQTKLATAHQKALEALGEASKRSTLEKEFKAQTKYSTLLGYVTALEYKKL